MFRILPDRPWGPPSLLSSGYRVSFPGIKRPGRGVDPPSPSSAEVKERVRLYLFSPSGPSWPVIGRTLLLPLFIYLFILFIHPRTGHCTLVFCTQNKVSLHVAVSSILSVSPCLVIFHISASIRLSFGLPFVFPLVPVLGFSVAFSLHVQTIVTFLFMYLFIYFLF
jgi:hypothetical protein